MKLVIPGNVPSQKNRKIISVNRATGRPFLRSSDAVKLWQRMAAVELRRQFAGLRVSGFPINIAIAVYFDNQRRHDLDNALATLMDALTAAEIIPDDNVGYVDTISISYGGLDKVNPRAEIYLDD